MAHPTRELRDLKSSGLGNLKLESKVTKVHNLDLVSSH